MDFEGGQKFVQRVGEFLVLDISEYIVVTTVLVKIILDAWKIKT